MNCTMEFVEDICNSADEMAVHSYHFDIDAYDRLAIGLVLAYLPLPSVENKIFEVGLGTLLLMKSLRLVITFFSNWYFIIVGAMILFLLLITNFGRKVVYQGMYYTPLLSMGLFVIFCECLKPFYLPHIPGFILRKLLKCFASPIKPTSALSGESEDVEKGTGIKPRLTLFLRSTFFRSLCIILVAWIALRLFQLAVNRVCFPLLGFLFSLVGYIVQLIGILMGLYVCINFGLFLRRNYQQMPTEGSHTRR